MLTDSPETVNTDPYGDGWLFSVRLDDPEELESLMDSESYKDHIDE